MKLGNLADHGALSINYGDYLQFLVIESLYKKIGVSSDDIVHIKCNEIETYRGERLLLPINFVSTIIIKNNTLSVSEDIHFLFLALSLSQVKEVFDEKVFFEKKEHIDFFLKFSPVGCRDEYTYIIMRKYGIPSYLNGCLTATLDRRNQQPSQTKVIFADAPSELFPYIPKVLFKECAFTTQQSSFKQEEIDDYSQLYEFVQNKYLYYEKYAKMVITSRLHVAVPCTAMGIPTIFAKDCIDTRFAWLEKLLPLHMRAYYGNIDWSPDVVKYEHVKKAMTQLACLRMKNEIECATKAQSITEFFLSRQALASYADSHKVTHENTARLNAFAREYWAKEEPIQYALWGINENAAFWVQYIREQYPFAELCYAVDQHHTGDFCGIKISKPSILEQNKLCYLLVVAVSAVQDAKVFMRKKRIQQDHICVVADSFIAEE